MQSKELSHFIHHLRIEEECWIWTGAFRKGHPVMWVGRKLKHVAPWSYRRYMIKDPPPDSVFWRRCGRRECVNPNHLEPVSAQELCRRRWRERLKREGGRKLTVEDVQRIHELLQRGELRQVEIAKLFGVLPSTITNIKKGRIWRSVEVRDEERESTH